MKPFILFMLAFGSIDSAPADPLHQLVGPIYLVPHPFAGGAGDVASNLIMADKLHEAHPLVDIYVVLTKDNESILRVLRPSLFSPAFRSQVPALYVPTSANLVLPGTVLSFSGLAGTNYPIRNIIVFEEYSGRTQNWIDRYDGRWIVRTGPSATGFYVRKNKVKPRGELEEIVRYLNESPVFKPPHKPVQAADAPRLGFGYSDSDRASRLYVEALIAWTEKKTDSKPTAVILKNHPGLLDGLEIPGSLKLYLYESIPMAESEWILSHTDIPILVTGDGSLTQALEWEKPLIYERLPHKHSVSAALEQYFGGLWLSISLAGSRTQDDLDRSRILEKLEDTEKLRAYTERVAAYRRNNSLLDALPSVIHAIESADRQGHDELWADRTLKNLRCGDIALKK